MSISEGFGAIGQVVPIGLLASASLVAAWLDLRYRRIPNWLCVGTAVAGLATAAVVTTNLSVLGSHALHLLAALLVGMVLFALGVFGGGDAKFYAGVAAWFPLSKAMLLLVCVTGFGLVVLIGWFTYRRIRGYPIRKLEGNLSDTLPYGIAIGGGAIIAMIA